VSVETAGVSRSAFGRLETGEEVALFTLRSGRGMEARVAAYGGVLASLRVPDRDGRMGDVVLGFDTLDGYVADTAFFGALIGRYANRIRGGRFTLDGREHALPVNNGANHLHGGPGGFHKVLWTAGPLAYGEIGVALTHTSPDGDQGYPGTLTARVVYRLTEENELVVEYSATTDAPTPVCLTQHTYFNLTGDPSRPITGHELMLEADRYTPVDETLIPTGERAEVAGTPFDFRAPTPIGARIGEVKGGGYDHNFVLRGDGGLTLAARVREPSTGRVLEVRTTEPGMQFYSGNYLDGSVRGKGGVAYGHRSGFCLEPQHFPDSPNQPSFPPAILRPGEEYRSRTVYRFGVD
jgi:aldose 1-epimerase